MRFRFFRHDDRPALRRALLAAIAARRTDVLRTLVELQGVDRVAPALRACSPRVVDDLISQLDLERGDALRARLQRGSLTRWRARIHDWSRAGLAFVRWPPTRVDHA